MQTTIPPVSPPTSPTSACKNVNLGKYICQERLGTGAYSQVFMALDPETQTKVAVKRLRKGRTDEKALRHELDMLKHLSNVCKEVAVCYRDFFEDTTYFYVVMDVIEGYEIGLIMNNITDIYDILVLIYNISMALYTIHKTGLAHNDIQPKNIVITPSEDIHFIDFGLACTQTVDCTALGTFQYMPPEKLDRLYRDKKASLHEAQQADVYALGVIFYTLVHKEAPRSPVRDPASIMSWVRSIEEYQQTAHYQTQQHQQLFETQLNALIDACLDRNVLRRINSRTLVQKLNALLEDYEQNEENQTEERNN